MVYILLLFFLSREKILTRARKKLVTPEAVRPEDVDNSGYSADLARHT